MTTSTYQRPTRDDLRGQPLYTEELHTLYLASSQGYTNAQIGQRLGRAEDSIKARMGKILAKLDARDRAHAVRRSFEAGYLTPPPPQEVAS